MYGAIEAGGTKFVCAVGTSRGGLTAEIVLPTTTPAETFKRVIAFFRPFASAGELRAVGVGSFGPLDLDRKSRTYGYIKATPKPGWRDIALVSRLKTALKVPIAIDTDVNAAALGEYAAGASAGIDPSLYVTIGTGIGGGFLKDGKPLHGLVNTEMGHIRIPHDVRRDPFRGSCPFHGDCFEGLASGPAIRARFDDRPELLGDDDPFWHLEAEYIAWALMDYILVLSPRIIILGGGVLKREFLYELIREKVVKTLNGYLQARTLIEQTDSYIVPPRLSDRSGIFGALALARTAK